MQLLPNSYNKSLEINGLVMDVFKWKYCPNSSLCYVDVGDPFKNRNYRNNTFAVMHIEIICKKIGDVPTKTLRLQLRVKKKSIIRYYVSRKCLT